MHEHTRTAALTTPHPTPVRFPCTAAPLVSMLLPLAQDEERGGRVLALLDQVPYFTERLDMDRDDLDHAPGEEEGTLVCGARKVVYADGECCACLGCGQGVHWACSPSTLSHPVLRQGDCHPRPHPWLGGAAGSRR